MLGKLHGVHIPPRIRRGITLTSAVFVALSAGTNYVFSAYSPQLASRLHLSSTALNGIGIAGNLGMYGTSPIAGKFIDIHGTKMPLAISSFLLFLGYGIVWWSYKAADPSRPSQSDHDTAPSIALLAFGMFCTGAGSSAALSSAANGVAKSFGPRYRATVIAATLAGFGLSAFLWATMAHVLFAENTGDFLLLLSLGPAITIAIGVIGVKAIPPGSTRQVDRPEEYAPLPSTTSIRKARVSYEALPSPGLEDEDDDEGATSSRQRVKPKVIDAYEVDIHGWQLFATADFPLILIVMGCLSGTGLMLINNLGTIVSTLYSYHRSDDISTSVLIAKTVSQLQAAQVSLLSIFNCLGRIFAGVSSDFLQSRYTINRGWYLTFVAFLFVLSQSVALIFVREESDVWKLVTLLGFAYGNLFGTLPVIILEWFGVPSFSTNFGIMNLSPVLFGQTFNLAFGRIYDSHISPVNDPTDDHSHMCVEGERCYRSAFEATLMACFIALFVSFVLAVRRRRKENVLDQANDSFSETSSVRATSRRSLSRRRSLSLGGEMGAMITPEWVAEWEAEWEAEDENRV